MLEHIFDPFDKVSALYDKQRDKFRLIGTARTKFGEVHILAEKFVFQLLDIGYFCDGNNGEAAEVRVDNDRLCVCVTDDADTGVSFKIVQFTLELGSEIGTFQIMNGTDKPFFLTICRESSPLCTQM